MSCCSSSAPSIRQRPPGAWHRPPAASTAPLSGRDAELERLRAELQTMRMKDLRERARAESGGLPDDQLQMAADSDNPKQALVELMVDAHASVLEAAEAGTATGEPDLQELREQLQGLRLRELKTRAAAEGISSETMDDADDSDDPKHFLIEVVLLEARKSPPNAAAAAVEKLRDELSALKLSVL
eukprot:SAG22_NODE_5855_length_942_cov_4.071174_1_plen_184_part_10